MSPKPKKPGLSIAIGVGKPKPDLGEPDPLEGPMKAHEAAETPEEEAGEEYGAKLLSDMTAPLTEAGLSDDEAKGMLAKIFKAVATCLEGDSGGEPAAEEGGEAPMGGMGAENYGR